MPEGDTIWRTAQRLKPALVGHRIVEFTAPRLAGPLPVRGVSVNEVEARGKHLLVHFADGTTLETHMLMTGSWHLYRVGERWRRSRQSAQVIMEMSNGWMAICFSAPRVEVRPTSRAGPRHLGPDLTGESPDLEEARRRLEGLDPQTPIGVVLLDQRVFCGVGNVYKSEVLHACLLDPATPLRAVSADRRLALLRTAHRLLRANLDGGPRTTVRGGLAVYDRAGQPCRRCGTHIQRVIQGEQARSTYWCATCQPAPGVTSPDS